MIKKKYAPIPHEAKMMDATQKIRKETLKEKGDRLTKLFIQTLNENVRKGKLTP